MYTKTQEFCEIEALKYSHYVLLLLALLRILTKITSRFGTTRYKELVESDKYLLNLYPYKLRL